MLSKGETSEKNKLRFNFIDKGGLITLLLIS